MSLISLTDLPANIQAELRAALGMPPDALGLITWASPRTPARIICEVWPATAETGRPAKRYLVPHVRWWKDAVALAGMLEQPNIRCSVVEAERAHQVLQEMEDASPSTEYLRVGRIWDMDSENCRAWQRQPAAIPVLVAA